MNINLYTYKHIYVYIYMYIYIYVYIYAGTTPNEYPQWLSPFSVLLYELISSSLGETESNALESERVNGKEKVGEKIYIHIYIYINICIYMYVIVYIYIYIYID
jgi:hypothetical protein